MLIVLSPAKTQDFTKIKQDLDFSIPVFTAKTELLINELLKLSKNDISNLMNVSEKIADTNYKRFRKFKFPFTTHNSKQALAVYKGDVYKEMDIDTYETEDYAFAQEHLRIISGLYGLLRPLDLIQAYRLEMDIKLETLYGKNIYEFWGDCITEEINKNMQNFQNKVLVNLASNEYFNAIDSEKINGKTLKITFKENKNGEYKVVGILAKRARGMMADYIIKNRIVDPEATKLFDRADYKFNKKLSSEMEYVFVR